MYQTIQIRMFVAILATIFVSGITTTGCSSSSDNSDGTISSTYTLGALVPETGDVSELGKTMKAAIELALEDVNHSYANSGVDSEVRLKIYDTGSNFLTADKQIKNLKQDNVSLVVGPALSASCYIVKDYADENEMLLISPSASAASLAIPDDNLMRLVPDDSLQAEALVNHIISQGITKLAVFTQSDLYGEGLLEAVADKFQNKGGEFIAAYNMRCAFTEETIRPLLSDLSSVIEDELTTTQVDTIGVLMILYQQGVSVMEYAGEYVYLGDIKWFGPDSLARNTLIIENQTVGAFAEKVDFTCTSMSTLFFDQEKYKALEERIMELTGLNQVSVYGILAYDATMLAAQALMDSGSSDPALLRREIRDLTTTYNGPSSPVVLNDADDRASPSHFDLWRVQSSDDNYTWFRDSAGTQ